MRGDRPEGEGPDLDPGHGLHAEEERREDEGQHVGGVGEGIPAGSRLEAQRRRAVRPGERETDGRGAEHPRTEHRGDRERDEGPEDGDVEPPSARHAARGDGASRFVDGVDMPVEPIIDRLARTTDQWSGQQDAEPDQRPLPGWRDAARDNAAAEGPHRREPGDGLEQLERSRPARSLLREQTARRACHD